MSIVIYALLQKTLEEFVKAVASTFNLSVQVLTSSMAQLNRTGEGATPEVKAMLGIAYEYFDQARYAAQPMVEKLRILVGTRALLRSATGQITGPRQEESDLLNAIVSGRHVNHKKSTWTTIIMNIFVYQSRCRCC